MQVGVLDFLSELSTLSLTDLRTRSGGRRRAAATAKTRRPSPAAFKEDVGDGWWDNEKTWLGNAFKMATTVRSQPAYIYARCAEPSTAGKNYWECKRGRGLSQASSVLVSSPVTYRLPSRQRPHTGLVLNWVD